MKRFLLLALTAGLMSPIAVKAESVWLLIGVANIGFETIPMRSMEQCEREAKRFKSEDRTRNAGGATFTQCLYGGR